MGGMKLSDSQPAQKHQEAKPSWPWLTSTASTAPVYRLYPRKGQIYYTKQGTSYVQFLHKPNTDCSLEEKMKALDELDYLGIWPCSLSTPNKSLFIRRKGIRSVV